MPPKKPRGAAARRRAATQQAPPSSEDAKPNVDQLNAEAAAEADHPSEPPSAEQIEPPSDLHQPPTDSQPINAPEGDVAAGSSAAPTTAPPTRRLDSLNATGPRGKKAVAAPRFAGRRSQAKREEAEKVRDEQSKTSGSVSRGGDGRGRGGRGRGRGRGRGGYMGEDRHSEPVASGPFSAGQVSKETRDLNKRWSHRGSGWKGFGGGSRSDGKSDSRTGGSAARPSGDGASTSTKPSGLTIEESIADDGYISTEDEDVGGQRRLDIEKLGVIDLTQDDDDDVDPLAPIRLRRVPHKEPNLGMNIKKEPGTEDDTNARSGSKKPADKSKEQDLQVTSQKITFQGVYSDSDSDAQPHIKPDPEPIGETTTETVPDEPPSSPETKRKGKERIKAAARTDEPPPEEEFDEETRMNREEDDRIQHDLDIVREEFGRPTDKDGNAAMLDADGAAQRDSKVYLFQFPPVLPDLEPVYVKPDPEAAPNGDVMQVDAPSNESKPIMIGDEPRLPKLPSGAVGKMKVHASGKVTLDWGGLRMCLGAGGKADLLQYVVATTLPDQKDQKEGAAGSASEEEGQAVNLGQVRGKMVVTPDWEALLH